MNRYIIYCLACLSICISILGCKQEEITPETEKAKGTLIISAEPDTKVYLDSENFGKLLWSANDKIGLYGTQTSSTVVKNNECTLIGASGQQTGKFSTEVAAGTYDKIYAYYPYTSGFTIEDRLPDTVVPFNIPEQQFQSVANNSEHLSKYGLYYAEASGVTIPENGSTNLPMNFKSAGAIIRFHIGPDGSMPAGLSKINNILLYGKDMDSDIVKTKWPKLALPDGHWGLNLDNPKLADNRPNLVPLSQYNGTNVEVFSHQVELRINDSNGLVAGDYAYMVVNPFAEDGTNYHFQVYVSDDNGQMYRLASDKLLKFSKLEASKIYTVKMGSDLTFEKAFYDISLNGSHRANCYVLPKNTSAANKDYAFSVQYEGNSTNPTGTTVQTVIKELSSDQPTWQIGDITIGRIEIESGGVDLIENAFLLGSFITFSLKPDVVGSVVISAKTTGIYQDKKDQTLWSWHIWVVDETLITYQDLGDSHSYKSMPGIPVNGVTFMNKNLGTTSGTSPNGLYYQWGRKDPLKVGNGSEHATMANSIKKPADFEHNWLTTTSNFIQNNWKYFYRFGKIEASISTKQAYDPCPYGWRMPNDNDWAKLYAYNSSPTVDDVNKVVQYDVISFPYGYISPSETSVKSDKYLYFSGSYTPATLNENSTATELRNFKVSHWTPTASPGHSTATYTPNYAALMRCVKIDEPDYND